MLRRMRFLLSLICGVSLPSAICLSVSGSTLAQFRTPLGDIEVELYDTVKPVTVQNFIRYVQSGAYMDMFFHRWVPGFVVQGGGFYAANRNQTNAGFAAIPTFDAIPNEYGVGQIFSNQFGTIAMARESGKTNSATSQWFFNLADNAALDQVDGGFTVFGRVLRGTNVLNRFNLTSAANGIYLFPLPEPLNELPVLSSNPTFDDLVYVDISLLNVQVVSNTSGQREISWQSVSNKVNAVEFTSQFPPVWEELTSTNGAGQVIHVTDAQPSATNRFYRIRVDY
jgi:cyclophilin family peptidyl-prolyl cis-trans isomerase